MAHTMPVHAAPGYRPKIIGYRRNGAPIYQVAGAAPTFDELIVATEVELEQINRNYDRAQEQIRTIVAKAKRDGRANLTADEDADIEAAGQARNRAAEEREGCEHKLKRLRDAKSAEERNEARLARSREDVDARPALPTYDQVARVGREERTYHRGNAGRGGLFLRDVTQHYLNRDIDAETRLQRHMQEERVERGQYLTRAVSGSGTGNFAGLTVPQYLTDMYAPAVAAMRPFADVCNHHDLPEQGMTVNISRITTPTTVQNQASENTDVLGGAGTDIDDTLLTENVQTAAGYAQLSRQAIDRGVGADDITMDDLQRRYATNLDSTLINQATTGLSAVGASQTFLTAGSMKVYAAAIQAMSTIETTLLGFAQPDVVVCAPRRWYGELSAFNSSWPLFGDQQVPTQSTGINFNVPYGKGIRGILKNGLKVCVDANVSLVCNGTALTGGAQDQMYVVPSAECHLWEDPNAPQFIRAEQPQAKNLAVQLVLYGYYAYSFRRYGSGTGAMVTINGAGLVAPAFDGS